MTEISKNVKLPKRGAPVRGSKSGQPIMVLFDLMGRRWTMGIIWNLSTENSTFRELQAKCDNLSPTLLNTRLKELRAVNLVEKATDGYALTKLGQELFTMLEPLGDWSYQWTAMQTEPV